VNWLLSTTELTFTGAGGKLHRLAHPAEGTALLVGHEAENVERE